MEQLVQDLATKVLQQHQEELVSHKEELEKSFDEVLKAKVASYEERLAEAAAKEKQWLTEKTQLQALIDELNQYKKVSLVKNLSNAVDNLKRENETLKKQPATPAPVPAPAPASASASAQKQKVEIKSKPAEVVSAPAAVVAPAAVPVPTPAPAPAPAAHEPEPEPEVVEESEPVPEAEEQVLDLMLLELDGAAYFHDSETNDLYEVIGDPDSGEVGDVIGKLKPIMANGKEYMLNTATQRFYNIDEEGHLLGKAGEVKNGKAVFSKK